MDLKEALLAKARERSGRHREEVTALFVEAGWADVVKDRRLYAQRMSGKARSTYEDYRDVYGPDPERGFGAVKRTGMNVRNLFAQLVVRCLADEGGGLLFAESEAEALGEADSELLWRIHEVCQRVNGMIEAEPLKNGHLPAGSGGPQESSAAPPES